MKNRDNEVTKHKKISLWLNSLIKIEPNNRPDIDLQKWKNQITSTLITQMNSNPSSLQVNIRQNTQVSLDMTDLDTLGDLVISHKIYTENRTDFHVQKESNLCHSFAILSAFRKCLIIFIKIISKNDPSKKVMCDYLIKEIEKPDGEFSYQKFFKIFISCVNPRSFQGLSKLRREEKFTQSQFANLETVIKRLVFGTTFEIEGWKRLLPAREIFKKLALDIDDYELKMEKIEKVDFEVRLFLIKVICLLSQSWPIFIDIIQTVYCKVHINTENYSNFYFHTIFMPKSLVSNFQET